MTLDTSERGKKKMKHTLHVIGYLGIKIAYLDISLEEAKSRFIETEHYELTDDLIETFEFDDKFGCYDAWKIWKIP